MMQLGRKVLAFLLSTTLAFSMVSATALTAFADGLAAGRADLPRAAAPMSSQIGTTTWTLDADGTLTIAPADGTSGALPPTDGGYIYDDGWREEYKQAERLVFEGSIKFASSSSDAFSGFSIGSVSAGADAAIAFEGDCSCSYMFADCSSLAGISGLSNWDMSSVTDMSDMFYDCSSLTDLSPLASWDTSSVTEMSDIFFGCSSLTDLSPLASWDTSAVEGMSDMFSSCSSLTDLSPLASWDTSSVAYIGMFSGCSSLTDLSPLASWDTSSAVSMSGMFFGCSSLTDLSPLASWDTSSAVSMSGMFFGCSSLTDLSPLASWDTSAVAEMFDMFSGCSSLTDLSPLASWDTSSVAEMSDIFFGCSSLTDLSPLASWDTSAVEGMSDMFSGCSSLTDLSPLASWDTSSAVYMSDMFFGCSSLTDLSPLASWDTSAVEGMFDMFRDASITRFVLGADGFPSQVRQWGESVEPPSDGKHTGRWVSADAVDKGPLTMAQIMEGWDPATMSGTWVAEEKGAPAGVPSVVDLSQATVSVAGAVYTGSALTPAVTVRCGGAVLRPGTDYAVAYTNNVNAGRGMATVTGRGGYAGAKAAEFTIAPADISKAKLAGLVSKPYAKGRAIKQAPAVKLGALTLKSGRDFAVSYKNNRKVGTATVTVTGKGNFAGAKAAKFKIVKHGQPMTVKAAKKTVTAKAKILKKKAVTLARPVTVKKAKGKVAYANASTAKAAKAFKVNARTGKVTLPKGTKKGAYTVRLKVAAKGAGSYAYGEKTVAVKVRVK